jgi:mannose-1-phosphate guanylyltransferase/mannose-6-phosphate isomerase
MNELNINVNYTIVSEPKGRDSAPAMCISALLGSVDDYTYVFPCDHVLNNFEFLMCMTDSFKYLDDNIITFGIKPTRVETGYGYIQLDESNNTVKFIEKPDYTAALKYFEDGNYLWNAGMFGFKNKNLLLCFKKYAPDIYKNCVETIDSTDFFGNIVPLSKSPFLECRAISVDYAIMENLCNDTDSQIGKKTVLYNSEWNDIGSYMALYDELEKDNNNNVVEGDVINIDTNDCYIHSESNLVATVGVHDLIIVNTDDALLICDKSRTQDVKKIVDKLKQSNREERIVHKTAYRPWGYYKNVEGDDNSGFKIKRISVYPGKRLSLQSHNQRSEHWVIVKGTAKVEVGKEVLTLVKDQSVYIPINALHRIENIGDELLEFTETQIGNYLGEDDIVRYQDDFGRV